MKSQARNSVAFVFHGLTMCNAIGARWVAGPASALINLEEQDTGTSQATFGPPISLFNWIDFSPAAMAWPASGAIGARLGVRLETATGSSDLPSEIDHLGTVFDITADTGDHATHLMEESALGLTTWVMIRSEIPFTSLTFFEPASRIQDQYFGNVAAAVAEPLGLAIMVTGFLGLATLRRGKRPASLAWRPPHSGCNTLARTATLQPARERAAVA